VAVSCEHGNEPWVQQKASNVLTRKGLLAPQEV